MAKRKKRPVNEKAAARRAARKAALANPPVTRPFEGLPSEVDWIAMREIVPAASAWARTTEEYGSVDVLIVTLLPTYRPAMKREDGVVVVALQFVTNSGDPSRDAAAALIEALDLEPGDSVHMPGLPGPGPRLQDVLVLDHPFEVTVHEDFAYAFGEETAADPDVLAALEETAQNIVPTVKLEGVEGGYWCRMGEREFLRWVRPEEEEVLLDGLARLQAQRASSFGDDSRLIGTFRANGVLVPVWELARGAEADEIDPLVTAFQAALDEAVAANEPLTPEERRARQGLVSRQVTLQ